MNPIRPLDLVRLRHTPACTGRVVLVADAELELDLAVVELTQSGLLVWVALDLLELVPEQIERLRA